MKKDCKNCEQLGRGCPKNLIRLPLEALIDWCLYTMAQYKLTHEDVAGMSGVPKGTLDRVLAKQSADCRYSTIHAIVCALLDFLGVPAVCLDEVTAEAATHDDALRQENVELRQARDAAERELQVLRKQVEEFEGRRDFLRGQIKKQDERIDQLTLTVKGWRRVVRILTVLLGVAVLSIIAALVADKLDPSIGFFWK